MNDTDSTEYQIERIVQCKRIDCKRHYKIKWLGYPTPTWEPSENIPNELIETFHIDKTMTGTKKKEKKKSHLLLRVCTVCLGQQ